MFKVMWWDAFGNPQMSELMVKDVALTFASTLLPEQEARIVFINT